MTLRALFATCLLGLVGLAAANDYDLVVPSSWDLLKSAKTIVVYSPDGALKPGDHITRIVPGGADGPGVRISAGWPSANPVELGKAGAVNGFAGSIELSTDGTGASGLVASIVPAGQGASRPPDDNIVHAFPWMYILVGAGALVAVGIGATLFRRSSVPGVPMRFSGRKGIEEGVREIRAKIDEIQEEQKNLVRKPPVLRSFRKQIDGFDHRLREIEETNQQTRDQLTNVASLIARLDERLNSIAQHSVNASGDSKKAIELVTKLSMEHSKHASTTEERLQKVAAAQEGITSISRDVSKAIDAVGHLGNRIDAVAAQNLGHENKLQAASSGIDAARKEIEATRKDLELARKDLSSQVKSANDAVETSRKQIERLEAKVGASGEGVDAARKGLAEVASKLQATDQRLNGLESQAQAAVQRGAETQQILAKSSQSVESGLAGLDARIDALAKSTEALHLNLQKSAEALQLNLEEISGRVSNTEGSLHANLQGLANELGTLRNEVGTLPVAMSSLGERVGSLDARLTPISERGDRLAEGFLGLQSRFEDAAKSLATQVEALEGRLEDIRSEGSKLANLPEVVQGNTVELAAQVKSAETGLKSLGEELAKLQEALLSDNKQSDVLAGELAQRLEAWESSLANVASKVEDLRAPVMEDDDDEIEQQPKKLSKKAKARAARRAQEQQAAAAKQAQPVQKTEEQKPTLELVENDPVIEEPAATAPVLTVEEMPAPAAEEEVEDTVEESAEPVAKELEPPVQELAAEGPQVGQIEGELQIEEDFDDEEGIHLEKAKAGRWTEMAGSSERLWSVKLPSAKPLPQVRGPIRPLTPIETPGIDSAVGAIICTGQGAAYVHGSTLQSFWPGAEARSVALQSPVPHDLWRLMMFSGYIYCAQERQVEIIHTSTWTKHAFFTGDYLNQAHTEGSWVGLMAWGDHLAVDFRDTLGNHVNSPRELGVPASEQAYFAASKNSAFVGTRSGAIFRVDPAGAVQLARPSKSDRLLSVSITKVGILAMVQGDIGIQARLLGKDGQLLKISDLGCQVMAHAPVVIGDRFYIFDDSQSELVTVSLKTLQVITRYALESTLGVNRMVGLACGKSHLLAMLATDDRGVCNRAFVLDVHSGQEMTLCPINHPRAELVAGDGHLVVATSSAYQNTIQVFNPFEAVDLKSKKAA